MEGDILDALSGTFVQLLMAKGQYDMGLDGLL